MKHHYVTPLRGMLSIFLFFTCFALCAQTFSSKQLTGESLLDPTSLDFGPDGRLYVSQQNGTILAYMVVRDDAAPGSGSYSVTATETINIVRTGVPNYNDDATLNTSITTRQVTGIYATGTAANPVLYVTSSDPRIGGGASGASTNLDTNSGVVSRLTWTGTAWDKVDIVRGLPRAEENHSINDLVLFERNGSSYLLLPTGGFTNKGAPSNNFAGTSETYLAGSLITINLSQLEQLEMAHGGPFTDPRNGSKYLYDLPTLNDPDRTDINNTHPQFPYPPGHPMYTATIDVGDPFGGNNGLNQAFVEAGGPVQIFSPGYRNAYDVVVTDDGRIFATDNGPNSNWGGPPVIYTSAGTVKANQSSYNPGAGDYVNNDFNEANSGTIWDGLHYVGNISDAPGTYYGGHPVPIRAFPSRAGVNVHAYNGSTWVETVNYDLEDLLTGVSGYYNSGFTIADFPDDSRQGEYLVGNLSSSKVNILDVVSSSTNGLCEYTASNFGGAMQGNLLSVSFNGNMNRYELNAAGTGLLAKDNTFFEGFGATPLDVIAQGDSDIFPGTIWAATYGSDNILIFEPADFGTCPAPGEAGYDPLADSDNDGYSNEDEVANNTNHCSGGSKPNDNDLDLISDLNDPDDDNDGIPDLDDVFAWDPENGLTTNLPVHYPFWNNDPGTGFAGLGFTGWMSNGSTDYLEQYDLDNLSFGGAGGKATIDEVGSGDALGGSNNQLDGFQFGVNADNNSQPFTVHSRVENPFGTQEAQEGQSQGIYIGSGDQDNYLKIVVNNGNTAGDGVDGIQVLLENGGLVTSDNTYDIAGMTTVTSVDLYLEISPTANTALPYYSIDGGSSVTALGSPINLPAVFLDPNDANGLAVGLIATATSAPTFTATWDFINVSAGDSGYKFRINAGGSQVTATDGPPNWLENASPGAYTGPGYTVNTGSIFNSNLTYANRHSSIPSYIDQATFNALFAQERFDPQGGVNMAFAVPLQDGNYTVNLYMGNSFSGTSEVGQRVYNILLEGNYVRQNFDLIVEFGHQAGGMLSFPVTVTDQVLNIGFEQIIQSPLVNAIEIIGNDSQHPPIVLQAIEDQNSMVGDNPAFSVAASGGDPLENFTYSIQGQPAGIDIEPTNGQVIGTVQAAALNGGPAANGVHSVTVFASKPGSSTANTSFNWTITDASTSWIDKAENENYTARHECSFVQAGDRFYLMGGRENARTLDIYNYTNNSWTSLSNSAPVEFNHYQAVEYKGLIWVIGAFKTNTFPTESPADHIWAFDPAAQEWIQGPEIPAGRKRGSAGLVVYNDKFYVVAGNTVGHDGGYVAWFDEYDPATGTWTPLANAPRARDHFHAAVIGNKLYAAGGRLSGGTGGTFKPVIPQVDVYDFTSNTWSTLPTGANLPTPRGGASVAVQNGKLLVIGGEVQNEPVYGVSVDDALKITEEYDPVSGSWTRLADLNHERHGTQAIKSGAGVFILGGSPNRGGGNQKNMEYLGADAPEGSPSVSSTVSAPPALEIETDSSNDIALNISNGNVGVIIRSMEITGPDAANFAISSGNLTHALLSPDSQHVVSIQHSGTTSGEAATLVINHGANSTLNINLSSVPDLNEGDQSIWLEAECATVGSGWSVEDDAGTSGGQYVQAPAGNNYNTAPTSVNSMVRFTFSANAGTYNVYALVRTPSGGSDSFWVRANGGAWVKWNDILPHNSSFNWNQVFDYDNGNALVTFTLVGGTNTIDIAHRETGTALDKLYVTTTSNVPSGFGGTDATCEPLSQAPIAVAGATPTSGNAPLQVNFTSAGSTDNDGTITGYSWDFGDGAGTSTLANPMYTYITPGNYTASLTVTDNEGAEDTDTININVTDPVQNGVVSLTLINADTDADLFNLTQGMTIDAGVIQGATLNIRANSNPSVVGSVFLSLTGPVNATRNENVAPYALFGDSNGNYYGNTLPLGNYTISATAYSGPSQSGTNLGNLSIQFSITEQGGGNLPPTAVAGATPTSGNTPLQVTFSSAGSGDSDGTITGYNWDFGDGSAGSSLANPSYTYNVAGNYTATLTVTDNEGAEDTDTININVTDPVQNGVVSLTLINADTDADMFTLTEGMQVDESVIEGTNLNIRANTSPSVVGSVFLSLSGPVSNTRNENVAPYALFGDSGGNYFGNILTAGNYTMTATAYSGSNQSGTNLGTLAVNFSIVSGAAKSTSVAGNLADMDNADPFIEISLYPNPSDTYSEITTKNLSTSFREILVFDVTGRLVKQYNASQLQTGNSTYQIQVNDMEEGIYFVKFIATDAKTYHKQLVVKKR